ncbi:MAG: hypothetical protein JW861_04500 [Bacteroidales bacterium]|nr:hypothetical protein [Bacteroidales bacterium]
MNIGITYDLREDYLKMGFSPEETAEFDRQETIDAIAAALEKNGFRTNRIGNIHQLCRRLAKGDRWDIVFNICEGLYGMGREAQAPALLDAFNIPYVFSDPLVLALTLHKGMTKTLVRAAGIPTADYHMVHSPSDIPQVNMPFPLFAKPVAEGTGKGIHSGSVIQTPGQLEAACRSLLSSFRQPVLVERFLPGREFTAGIVGTGEHAQCIGVMEIVLKEEAETSVYSYHNKEDYEKLVEYHVKDDPIVEQCVKVALDSWRMLGCRDGGRVDIRCDEHDIPNFIEVNPLAGLHPVHSDLPILASRKGIGYPELIGMIMQSALRRVSS